MDKWYVVQVVSGKEYATRDLVERLVPGEVIAECFVPAYETQIKFRGAWKTVQKPLFPGYVVAVTSDIDALRLCLRGVPEFTRVLACGETFVPLDEADKALICVFTQKDDRTVAMSFGVMDGDCVVVTAGPLTGREGWISGINRHKNLAFLEIEMFGRTLKTKVGLGVLRKKPGEEASD